VFWLGSHTVNHPLLSTLSENELQFEIQNSREALGNPTLFAYPFGYPQSYSKKIIKILMQNGFKAAFTTIPKHNPLPLSNPFEIGRFSIGNETKKQFSYYVGLTL
jgi:peptidoglycan/xylan/chitin deacetylase (PgdA/CDA1 family)